MKSYSTLCPKKVVKFLLYRHNNKLLHLVSLILISYFIFWDTLFFELVCRSWIICSYVAFLSKIHRILYIVCTTVLGWRVTIAKDQRESMNRWINTSDLDTRVEAWVGCLSPVSSPLVFVVVQYSLHSERWLRAQRPRLEAFFSRISFLG